MRALMIEKVEFMPRFEAMLAMRTQDASSLEVQRDTMLATGMESSLVKAGTVGSAGAMSELRHWNTMRSRGA
jgi:hypothetical protein